MAGTLIEKILEQIAKNLAAILDSTKDNQFAFYALLAILLVLLAWAFFSQTHTAYKFFVFLLLFLGASGLVYFAKLPSLEETTEEINPGSEPEEDPKLWQERLVQHEEITTQQKTSVFLLCDEGEVMTSCKGSKRVGDNWKDRGVSDYGPNGCGTSAEPGILLRLQAKCVK